MLKRVFCSMALLAAVAAAPGEAQMMGVPRISVEPFVGYGFFGSLPDDVAELEADVSLGARAAYLLSPQFSIFAMGQRSTPEVTAGQIGGFRTGESLNVDHWSAGVEFSYVPRGGAEGMLPILLEAGLGQARYEGDNSDLAVNLGIASALQLSPNLAIRYGANDYISNFEDRGITNQIFVRVGAELSF